MEGGDSRRDINIYHCESSDGYKTEELIRRQLEHRNDRDNKEEKIKVERVLAFN